MGRHGDGMGTGRAVAVDRRGTSAERLGLVWDRSGGRRGGRRGGSVGGSDGGSGSGWRGGAVTRQGDVSGAAGR